MKVVLVHDWLTNMGGAEKVLIYLAKLFPDAPIYTSVVNYAKIDPFFKTRKIIPTFLQGKKPYITNHKKYFPFMPLGFKCLKLEKCDVVISSSSSCAKMVKIPKGAIHVCYCHTPMRYAYFAREEYVSRLSKWIRPLANLLLKYMRYVDKKSNKHVDYFIANSNEVKRRIHEYYQREAITIFPGVEVDKFQASEKNEGYYLCLSRLVYYKRFDLAIKACNALKKRLIIVGGGEALNDLKEISGPTIEFVNHVSDEELINYFMNAKAFIFPAYEDFGIVPIEAMACGKPVIAFNKGGTLDTVIDNVTGIFFSEQSPQSVAEAIIKLENTSFNPFKIRQHALKFSVERFQKEILDFINNLPLKTK